MLYATDRSVGFKREDEHSWKDLPWHLVGSQGRIDVIFLTAIPFLEVLILIS